MNFVKEGVDKPEEGEEPVDTRPLYFRLKEVKDKKQLEFDEERALKNQLKGVDEEDVEFFGQVDKAKAAEQRKRKQEEEDIVKQARNAVIVEPAQPSVSVSVKPQTAASSNPKQNKQANLLAAAVRKRPASENTPAVEQIAKRPSLIQPIGILPGIAGYSGSSDSDEDSSNSSGDDLELPSLASFVDDKNAGSNQQGSRSAPTPSSANGEASSAGS
ncbi:NEFA-interacting nuclear protein NIP30 [Aphelenchoides avenae]|nr:NEFA-interacting nuclear protein NIP30 [Aphelenchus avenae]